MLTSTKTKHYSISALSRLRSLVARGKLYVHSRARTTWDRSASLRSFPSYQSDLAARNRGTIFQQQCPDLHLLSTHLCVRLQHILLLATCLPRMHTPMLPCVALGEEDPHTAEQDPLMALRFCERLVCNVAVACFTPSRSRHAINGK